VNSVNPAPMDTSTSPDLSAPSDWSPIDAFPQRSFVSGDSDGQRLRIRYYERDGALLARVWFGPDAEGPPGHAHGGALAAVLDEAMGYTAWLAGHPVVAARLTTDFRRMLPLGTVCTIEPEVERVEGRKVHVAARIVGPDGTVYAEASAIFVGLGPDALDALNAIRNASDA
jgi:acyl-coenzyme A thioesterase PaaI-like protein